MKEILKEIDCKVREINLRTMTLQNAIKKTRQKIKFIQYLLLFYIIVIISYLLFKI